MKMFVVCCVSNGENISPFSPPPPPLWRHLSAREMALAKFTGKVFLVQSKWAITRCHQFECMPVATETEAERLFSRILLNI